MKPETIMLRMFINRLVDERPDLAKYYVDSLDEEIREGLGAHYDDLYRCYKKLNEDEIKAFTDSVLVSAFGALGCDVISRKCFDEYLSEQIEQKGN